MKNISLSRFGQVLVVLIGLLVAGCAGVPFIPPAGTTLVPNTAINCKFLVFGEGASEIVGRAQYLANMCTSPNIKISTSNLHFWIKPKLNEHSKKVIFTNFSHLVKIGNDHTSIISEEDYPF